jgi:heavy metal response regulator
LKLLEACGIERAGLPFDDHVPAEAGRVKILIVEDEKKVADFVRKGLQEEGYVVDAVHDGEEGLRLASENVYDLVILDIYLPKLDGLAVLTKLRQEKVNTPVLLLTVRATIEDKVLGLDSGADDYLTKPFIFKELLARVRALLRRRMDQNSPVLTVHDLSLDPVRRTVTRGDRKIELTMKEFSLLEYLMRNAGRVLTRTMIIDHVWNYDFDSETNVVDVYVNYLRKKVDAGHDVKLIHTIRGVGYTMKGGSE